MIAEALMCMALNIYHEARNQSMVGQVAVGEVKPISNSQRYKMLGNGFTVDVIAHILKGVDA